MNADAQRWADYQPWLRAILDEYARAIRELQNILEEIPQERYVSATDLSDDEFPAMREIMEHVVGAANRYVDYIEDAIAKTEDKSSRQHQFLFGTPAEGLQSLWDGFHRMVDTLGLIKDRSDTDEELAAMSVTTRWGQTYDIEQMLEHAICHILRHRRQVERWLVRRTLRGVSRSGTADAV